MPPCTGTGPGGHPGSAPPGKADPGRRWNGLYGKVLLGGLVDGPGPDETLRCHYRDLLEHRGREFLHDLLTRRDPRAAATVRPTDAVRVIRALEVLDQTGRSIVDIRADHRFADRPYDSILIGLAMERSELFSAIDRRVDAMLGEGLVEEVEGLRAMGFGEDLRPMQALGYRQIVDYIRAVVAFPKPSRRCGGKQRPLPSGRAPGSRRTAGSAGFTPGREEAVRRKRRNSGCPVGCDRHSP